MTRRPPRSTLFPYTPLFRSRDRPPGQQRRRRADAGARGVSTAVDLSGKVALVTGGSRGLGREMVLGLAAAGADVVVASRDLASCEKTAAEVRETTGRRALPVSAHVGRWEGLDELVDTVHGEFGRVDVLVNNAGMSPRYDTVADVSEVLFDKVLGVNLKGPFRLAALVGTRMAAGEGGSIINVSSTGAVRPRADIVPYAAAKAGLNAVTVGLARSEEHTSELQSRQYIVCRLLL